MKKTCMIKDCEKPAHGQHCEMHRARLRRHGHVDPGRFSHGPVEERYWRYVVKGDGCWDWLATKNNHGYGTLGSLYAHRISYEIHHGPIPAGHEVMHSCDNPACSNPAHLTVGTHAANMRDAAQKGRMGLGRPKVWGERSSGAKLTAVQVDEIRRLRAEGIPRARVAERFGVGIGTISDITSGKTWRYP